MDGAAHRRERELEGLGNGPVSLCRVVADAATRPGERTHGPVEPRLESLLRERHLFADRLCGRRRVERSMRPRMAAEDMTPHRQRPRHLPGHGPTGDVRRVLLVWLRTNVCAEVRRLRGDGLVEK